jgi:hypothetical protein
MREFPLGPPKPANPFAWLWEPLEEDPTFLAWKMFGSVAIYLDGKMMLCFINKTEPWRGMLVCTRHEHHASLMSEFPGLQPHPVLAKWLYIPESDDRFERTAEKIVRQVLYRDPRIGVDPPPKKRKKKKRSTK